MSKKHCAPPRRSPTREARSPRSPRADVVAKRVVHRSEDQIKKRDHGGEAARRVRGEGAGLELAVGADE